MPAGAAYKRLRPASIEINTQNHSAFVCAPLAPPNARPARSIKVPNLFGVISTICSTRTSDQDGDLRLQGGDSRRQIKTPDKAVKLNAVHDDGIC